MSNRELKWGFGLEDKLSGPAKAMADALTRVEGALAKVTESIGKLDATLSRLKIDNASIKFEKASAAVGKLEESLGSMKTERVAADISRVTEAIDDLDESAGKAKVDEAAKEVKDLGNKADDATKKLKTNSAAMKANAAETKKTKSAWERAHNVLGALKNGLSLVSGAVSMMAGIAKKAFAPTKFQLGALMFKEQALTAFELMLGTQDAANEAWAQAQRLADFTGEHAGNVAKRVHGLLSAGFKVDEIPVVYQAVGDVAATELDPSKFDALTGILSRLKTMGRTELGDLKSMVKEAGVDWDTTLKHLSRNLGVSVDRIEHELAGKQISADAGIVALLDSIAEKSGGVLGTAMVRQADTLYGRLTKLKNLAVNKVFQLDLKDLRGYQGLNRALSLATDLLDANTEAGKKLREVFEGIDERLAQFLSRYEGEEGLKQLKADLENLVDTAVRFADALGKIAAFLARFGAAGAGAIGKLGTGKDMTRAEAAVTSAAVNAAFIKGGAMVAGPKGALGGAALGMVAGAATFGTLISAEDRGRIFAENEGNRTSASMLFHGPKLATGGIVTKPTIALIGEAGPEAVVPLPKMQQMPWRNRPVINFHQAIHVSGAEGDHRALAVEVRREVEAGFAALIEQLNDELGAAA